MWYLTVLPTNRAPAIPNRYNLGVKDVRDIQKARGKARRVWRKMKADWSSCNVELNLIWETNLKA